VLNGIDDHVLGATEPIGGDARAALGLSTANVVSRWAA
jgi:hypothetical protein